MIAEVPRTFGKLHVQDVVIGIDVEYLAEVCIITHLQPMTGNENGVVLGCIDLRGRLIPVLDTDRLCGLAEKERPVKYAAILTFNAMMFAIGVDDITGLSKVRRNEFQAFTRGAKAAENLSSSAFIDNGRMVVVLDVESIFENPSVPKVVVHRKVEKEDDQKQNDEVKRLIFCAGGTFFSLTAADVYATVPRNDIDQNALTSGISLGTIDYRGQRVTVICTIGLLGIGHPRGNVPSEVIILQFGEGQLLGLAVDSIESLRAISISSFSSTPRAVIKKIPLISHVMVEADGTQIYDIDLIALQSDSEIIALANIFCKDSKEISVERSGEMSVQGNKYIIYDCGGKVATPIDQISSILEEPVNIVPLTNQSDGLTGVFSLAEHAVPLVDLARRLDLGHSDKKNAIVLLVGEEERQVGFSVDKVIGIAVEKRLFVENINGESNVTVQLMTMGVSNIFMVVDLIQISESLSSNIQAERQESCFQQIGG